MSIVPQRGNHDAALRHLTAGHRPRSDAFKALGLTCREAEVLFWITEGKRDREIACIIGVSARTAQNHVAHILHKLCVETRTAAARIGLERVLTSYQPQRNQRGSK
jgi:DNA-binding CsgD family transcriptional regulator